MSRYVVNLSSRRALREPCAGGKLMVNLFDRKAVTVVGRAGEAALFGAIILVGVAGQWAVCFALALLPHICPTSLRGIEPAGAAFSRVLAAGD